ncbi:hypothetical protein AMATHDRAFT_71184 [Amanita thiersii Skay4041]|uniref:Uncharacterized protein n=1 Tax=Amanita thiersii Skay4041 TaxID=703135 RepID=A0A2A9N936_9AGAR|nr:hypothetical protein AMATHDRAFT_71184 [Amanita thiersii Skay4041]
MAVPELPHEIWFKIHSIVIASGIHAWIMFPKNARCMDKESRLAKWKRDNLPWQVDAFGTLRLVSKMFDAVAVEVAKAAFRLTDEVEFDLTWSGDPIPTCEMSRGEIACGDIRGLYHIFKAIKLFPKLEYCQCYRKTPILAAYIQHDHGFVCRAYMFSRQDYPDSTKMLELSTDYHNMTHEISGHIVLHEAMELVRASAQREKVINQTGFEVMTRMHQLSQRLELLEPSFVMTNEFNLYLDETYQVLRKNSEMYTAALKEIDNYGQQLIALPGVEEVVNLIIKINLHPDLVNLVTPWTRRAVVIPEENDSELETSLFLWSNIGRF